MKLKLGIIYGILIWLLTYIISNIFQPVVIENIVYMNIIVPLSIIVVTGFFGILYIRNFNENEVIEGIKGGILFSIIDIICDLIFFVIPNNSNILISNYPFHIVYMTIIILIITTLLGYLAQMNIELK
ncbi:MAG: hypothetical protein IJ104_06465 [Methanobrevibacter sp.]|nr:hypothetical protein [Methanobrevibacter sp.]